MLNKRALALFFLLVAQSIGQTAVNLGSQSRNADFSNLTFTRPATVGAVMPPTCVVGQLFFNTSVVAGQNLYACTSTNTWVAIGRTTLSQAGVGVLGGVKVGTNSSLTVEADGTLSTLIGTTTGTVAAGNDSRITGALQSTNNLADLPNASSALQNLGLTGSSAITISSSTTGNAATASALQANAAVPWTQVANVPTSSATQNGLLSSSDWASFSAKQSALGYSPLNPSNNLAEISNPSTALANLGGVNQAQAAALAPVQTVAGVAPSGGNIALASANLSDSASLLRTATTSAQALQGALTAPIVNNTFNAAGFPSSGCTVSGRTYTTQLDCAVATATAWITTNLQNAQLIIPPGTWSTCAGITAPALSNSPATLDIEGSSKAATVIVQTCPISTATLYYPDAQNGNMRSAHIHNLRLKPNGNATACMDLFGLNLSGVEHVRCSASGAITGTDHFVQIGDFASRGNNGWVYGSHFNDIVILGPPLPVALAHAAANVVGGQITSFTMTDGGSNGPYTVAHPQVLLYGSGNGHVPCSSMPTSSPVATVSGGLVTGIAPASLDAAGEGSGCSGTIYVVVANIDPVKYGISFQNATDNDSYNLQPESVGTTAAIVVQEGTNRFYSTHPDGGAIGIQDFGANLWFGTEIDSMYQYGADLESASYLSGISFYWNHTAASADYAVSSGFYVPTTLTTQPTITGTVACTANNVPTNYNEFWTENGPTGTGFGNGFMILANNGCNGGSTNQSILGQTLFINSQGRSNGTTDKNSNTLVLQASVNKAGSVVNMPWTHQVVSTSSGTPTYDIYRLLSPSTFVTSFSSEFQLTHGVSSTSSTNYSSPLFGTASHYWDGSADQTADCSFQTIPGTGSNPAVTLSFACTKTGASTLPWKFTFNGNPVALVLSGTTASIGGSAVSGACASGSVAIGGVTSSMVASVSPVSSPGNFSIYAVPTSGSVTVYVCGTGTPAATTYNVRVVQ